MYCKLDWIKMVKSILINVTYRSVNKTELNTRKHGRNMFFSSQHQPLSRNMWPQWRNMNLCFVSWGDDLSGGLFWGLWFLPFSLCPLSSHSLLSNIYNGESQSPRNNSKQWVTSEHMSFQLKYQIESRLREQAQLRGGRAKRARDTLICYF